jgi:3'-phosphoadenosine 5'-phosphosulfate sulfotransferase (PAPS reductase)/FAD synthetase
MEKIIGWWSGGVTSAVACKLAIDLFGKENCRIIFIDTRNEDADTYRFMEDCKIWYDLPIETITSDKHNSIQDVWVRYKALNNATGAVCSSELKRLVREKWEKTNEWKHQVFGFDLDEAKRAKGMILNHSQTKPIFPLMMFGIFKKDCIKIIKDAGIEIPIVYAYGYLNNNCFKTGCVQGGIGYWQKIKREFPEKFLAMAQMEHKITDLKGKPITMLKDQSNKAKDDGNYQVFLIKHPNYPQLKSIDDMRECKVEPLFECNGFCGVNDLEKRTETEHQINYELTLF